MKRLHPISAVIIAHRYSPLFERVVQRVSWCDEVIIVVSDLVPEIEELCRRVGAKYFFREFSGYGPQKQYAFSLASHDWILSVDSDEVVTPLLQNQIEDFLSNPQIETFAAFDLEQHLVFLDKQMHFGGTKTSTIRLFNRKKAQMNLNSVHEQIETSGKVGHLNGGVLHYSYPTLEDYLEKFNRYTSLGAEELYRKGKRTSLFSIWVRLPLLFWRRFLFQLGFLDGSHGFIWAALSAWYPFIKYLKLRDLNRKSIPVLMYHSLSSDEKNALNVKLEDFSKQLEWLTTNGYQSITLAQFLDFQEGRLSKELLPSKPVLFTFDDGYRNVLEFGLPLLQKYKFTACLFVTSSFVLEREKDETSRYFSFSDLKKWSSVGMEIALHTHSHKSFRVITSEEVLKDLQEEEEILQKQQIPYLRAIAYPFGARPKNAQKLKLIHEGLKEKGYRAAFRIGNRVTPFRMVPNRFEIKRLDIQGNKSFSDFCRKIEGNTSVITSKFRS